MSLSLPVHLISGFLRVGHLPELQKGSCTMGGGLLRDYEESSVGSKFLKTVNLTGVYGKFTTDVQKEATVNANVFV